MSESWESHEHVIRMYTTILQLQTLQTFLFSSVQLVGPLGRVGHRIADYGQIVRFFFFFKYKIEWVNMVLRILNLEGHDYCMIGSNVAKSLTMFFVHDELGFFGSGTSLLWIMGESAGERLWLLALVTGGIAYVTCDS